MRCPYCGVGDDRVVDSRESREGAVIRRRRECNACQRRFTSYETVEDIPLLVVKKDGRREPFDHGKISAGLKKACEKRPVSAEAIEGILRIAPRIIVYVSCDVATLARHGVKWG